MSAKSHQSLTDTSPDKPLKVTVGFDAQPPPSSSLPIAIGSSREQVQEATARSMGTSYRSQLSGWANSQRRPSVVSASPRRNEETPAVSVKTSMTKAERKAQKQAEKAAAKEKAADSPKPLPKPSTKKEGKKSVSVQKSPGVVKQQNVSFESKKEWSLFSHLPILKNSDSELQSLKRDLKLKGQEIHPSIMRLGLQLRDFRIVGSNNRAIALVQCLRELIRDYDTPHNDVMSRHMDAHLKHQLNFVIACRPNAVSTGSVIRYLKQEVSQLAHDMPDSDAKAYLDEQLVNYVNDKIVGAGVAIIQHCQEKIRTGDVIMTYAHSTLVLKALLKVWRDGVQFRVVVVDSRPLLEGVKTAQLLQEAGIQVTYIHISGISDHMNETSKVIVGAHAMLSNGVCMSRTGTALLAMMAKQHRIPCIVLCEGYKFSERVQLDSFVLNELAKPSLLTDYNTRFSLSSSVLNGEMKQNDISKKLSKQANSNVSLTGQHQLNANNKNDGWQQLSKLSIVAPLYDITSAEYISLVISDVGCIPSISVPVVIRERQS